MKSKKIPLSIVIPCADDIRIKQCLDSVDENVEIVVVLNGPTKEVVEIVNNYQVKKIRLPERNLAKALNVGMEKARNLKVILVDSDCKFQKGAIKKLYKGLKENFVVKGKVIFESNSFLSRVIARTREYVYYNPPKPYNPFLGIRKDIKKYIKGYYFDELVYWTEDADLNTRLKQADVNVKYIFSAKVFHPPLTIRKDLRSSFRYGIGKRIRVEKGTSNGIGTHVSNIMDIGSKKGVWSAVYYFLWNLVYASGYFYQILKDPYKTRLLTTKQK